LKRGDRVFQKRPDYFRGETLSGRKRQKNKSLVLTKKGVEILRRKKGTFPLLGAGGVGKERF